MSELVVTVMLCYVMFSITGDIGYNTFFYCVKNSKGLI